MASFSAKLKLETEKSNKPLEFVITNLIYKIDAPIDVATGQLSGHFRGNILELDLDIAPQCVLILNSVIHNETVKKAEITFYKTDQESKYMVMNVSQGHIFSYEQTFHAVTHEAMGVKIKISAQKFEFVDTDGGLSTSFDITHK
jgi:hypothetical protein